MNTIDYEKDFVLPQVVGMGDRKEVANGFNALKGNNEPIDSFTVKPGETITFLTEEQYTAHPEYIKTVEASAGSTRVVSLVLVERIAKGADTKTSGWFNLGQFRKRYVNPATMLREPADPLRASLQDVGDDEALLKAVVGKTLKVSDKETVKKDFRFVNGAYTSELRSARMYQFTWAQS